MTSRAAERAVLDASKVAERDRIAAEKETAKKLRAAAKELAAASRDEEAKRGPNRRCGALS